MNAIKCFLKDFRFTKELYRYLKHIQKQKRLKKRKKGMEVYLEKGPLVMEETQKVICKYGLKNKFFFAHGTILGIIRDGKLIDRDMDLDMIVCLDTEHEKVAFRKHMINNGYILLHSFSIDSIGSNQDTFQKDGVLLDINYSIRKQGYYYTYVLFDTLDEKNRVLYYKYKIDSIKLHKFGNFYINIPYRPESYLEQIYGANWRIPEKNYIYWQTPQVTITSLKGKIDIKKRFEYA